MNSIHFPVKININIRLVYIHIHSQYTPYNNHILAAIYLIETECHCFYYSGCIHFLAKWYLYYATVKANIAEMDVKRDQSRLVHSVRIRDGWTVWSIFGPDCLPENVADGAWKTRKWGSTLRCTWCIIICYYIVLHVQYGECTTQRKLVESAWLCGFASSARWAIKNRPATVWAQQP